MFGDIGAARFWRTAPAVRLFLFHLSINDCGTIIMIDFSNLNGYEFEDCISSLLKDKGFHVVQTDYSNDGGIDVIATWDGDFFKGKYIIQCKNWNNNVGQPFIRDLYGVVMSERANKGILITTSDFTQQAYDFADGKNLELINGIKLKSIISNTVVTSSQPHKSKSNFNHDRYDYLTAQLKENLKSSVGLKLYHEIMGFLWAYFWEQEFSTSKSDRVFDIIIDLSNNVLKKTANIKKDDLNRRYSNVCKLMLFNSYIVIGNLYDATNILLDAGDFYLDVWYPNYSYCYRLHPSYTENMIYNSVHYCPNIRAQHLLYVFRHIGYDKGADKIINHTKPHKFFADSIMCNGKDYTEILQKNAIEEKEKVLNGYYDNRFYWSSTRAYYLNQFDRIFQDHRIHNRLFSVDYNKSISLDILQNEFYTKDNQTLYKEIEKSFSVHGI